MANSSDKTDHATILKLLSGPQRGAEMPLDKDEYLIGSRDDCDIVLLDETVAGRHALLRKRNGVLYLTAQDKTVLIGEQELGKGENTELPAATVIALGTSYIGLGPSDTDWLSLPLPVQPSSLANAGAKTASVEQTGSVLQADVLAPEKTAAVTQGTRTKSGVVWTAAGTVVAIVLALVLFRQNIHTWWNDDALANTVTPDLSLSKTKVILDELGLNSVEAGENARGDIILRGYSATESVKQNLLNALEKADIQIISHVWAADTLQRALRETLNRLGAGQLDFNYLGAGVVQLQGFFDADIAKEELLAILRQDVPAISRIDADVRTLADSVADLRTRVRNAGLSDLITVAAQSKDIVVDGNLEPDQAPLWQSIVRAFRTATQGVPNVISYVKVDDNALAEVERPPAAEPVAATTAGTDLAATFHPPLRLSVRGIVMGKGKTPYALLSNGLRVSKGDLVGENYIIDAIKIDRIIVRNGSQTYVYYIGEGS